MENFEQNRQNRNPMTKALVLVVLYILITFSAQYGQHTSRHGLTIAEKIHNHLEQLRIVDIVNVYEIEEVYSGTWNNLNVNSEPSTIPLSAQEGKFHLTINRLSTVNRRQRYMLYLVITNGEYIDQGSLEIKIVLDSENFTSTRPNENAIALAVKEGSSIDSSYIFSKILVVESQGPLQMNQFRFMFELGPQKQLTASINIPGQDYNLLLNIRGHEPRLMKLIIFAVVIFIVAYTPFTAALQLLKQFFEGSENPLHYSLATMTILTMWDTVVCLMAFKIAFNDQESLVMFILPAFMLCLLFTNLEPRLMLLIFQRNQVPGQTRRCFNFNVLSYGSLIAIYPILIFTNINRSLFIAASCLMFPQIYLNAVRGKRPEPFNSYHIKFILSRFLIIIYLRMFPLNIFSMQPDYTLGILCLSLIVLQFGLLYLQKKYGPKIVVPKWMLEPVFDYNYEEALNLEDGGQEHECAICLMPLRKDPPGPEERESECPFRLMKTPCKHNYHSSCLISWMKIKMECPQCRSMLPPYE